MALVLLSHSGKDMIENIPEFQGSGWFLPLKTAARGSSRFGGQASFMTKSKRQRPGAIARARDRQNILGEQGLRTEDRLTVGKGWKSYHKLSFSGCLAKHGDPLIEVVMDDPVEVVTPQELMRNQKVSRRRGLKVNSAIVRGDMTHVGARLGRNWRRHLQLARETGESTQQVIANWTDVATPKQKSGKGNAKIVKPHLIDVVKGEAKTYDLKRLVLRIGDLIFQKRLKPQPAQGRPKTKKEVKNARKAKRERANQRRRNEGIGGALLRSSIRPLAI